MILRDPVHGILAFESAESSIVEKLLEAPELQRLRRVRQLGVTSLAFPGAEHTRFAHALGATHVMQRLIHRLRELHEALPFWQRLTSDRAQDALSAALLHDVGHGPLSHLFESALPDLPHHETWSERVILDPGSKVHQVLAESDPGRPKRVAALIAGWHDLPYLATAVSGVLDVDRCDYLLRDAHATGVRYGQYDLDWLLRSLRFGIGDTEHPPRLAIDGAKGLVAIEEFLLARFFMFQQVYFHKATRAAECMIRAALRVAVRCLTDGDALSSVPPAFQRAARGEEVSLGEYLGLDDVVVWAALRAWEDDRHPVLADLARRIRLRDLPKTYEIFGTDEDAAAALATARDIARAAGFDPEIYVELDTAEDTPFDPADDPPLVLFAKGAPRALRDVSFLLGRLAGETLCKRRVIFPRELREPIVAALSS